MTFRFREFSVEDDRSTMRIGTDAILLGAWIDASGAEKILDIGTGCGVIALMIAQKSNAQVDAIDINQESVDQARLNFDNSPWKDRLTAWHRSFREHAASAVTKYDIILTNPPYFRNSLRSADTKRNLARHHESFSFDGLFEAVNTLLKEKGSFYLILPETNTKSVRELGIDYQFSLNKILKIRPKETKNNNRVLMKFCRIKPEQETVDELVLRHSDNSFTREYKELTANFYLSLP